MHLPIVEETFEKICLKFKKKIISVFLGSVFNFHTFNHLKFSVTIDPEREKHTIIFYLFIFYTMWNTIWLNLINILYLLLFFGLPKR